MGRQSVEIAIVGGGQAALALSYHLRAQGRDHVILEQGRAVESWRSRRWDSLRLIAPNWSLIMPGFAYAGPDPNGFMGRDEVVDHLVGYARSIGAPIEEGVRVEHVGRDGEDGDFVLRTPAGERRAANVVVATGSLQRPKVPADAGEIPARVIQLVPADYRNPNGLPPGRILIVGSGETGVQIAEELARSGREVFLAGGRSWWAPRRYRGRDIATWLRLTGWFERLASDLPAGARAGLPNPQLTGAAGGHDISPHSLAHDGVTLLGRLRGISNGILRFADDVAANVAWGDEQARSFIVGVDRLVDEQHLEVSPPDLPADLVDGRHEPRSFEAAPKELDLARDAISTVIWATGYRPDLGWLDLPFLDHDGYPIQRRGVTRVPGLYVIGLDWLHTAKSGLFAGIVDDSSFLAAAIASRRGAGDPATQV
jgi:putative flavoprotein involved in K+ transport